MHEDSIHKVTIITWYDWSIHFHNCVVTTVTCFQALWWSVHVWHHVVLCFVTKLYFNHHQHNYLLVLLSDQVTGLHVLTKSVAKFVSEIVTEGEIKLFYITKEHLNRRAVTATHNTHCRVGQTVWFHYCITWGSTEW